MIRRTPYTSLILTTLLLGVDVFSEEIHLPFPSSIIEEDDSIKVEILQIPKSKSNDVIPSKNEDVKNSGSVELKNQSSPKNSTSNLKKDKLISEDVSKPTTSNQINQMNTENSNLPNVKDSSKKNTKSNSSTNLTGKPAYDRATYHQIRPKNDTATKELKEAIDNPNEFSTKAKIDQVRLLAMSKKKSEAIAIIQTIEDQSDKIKAYFELAMGLEKVHPSSIDIEEIIEVYLKILTEAPDDHEVLPRTLWALSKLHYKKREFKPALEHLGKIIQKHKRTEYMDDAIYLSGRIYESGDDLVRDRHTALRYYEYFLKSKNVNFKNSIYLKDVKRRYQSLKM